MKDKKFSHFLIVCLVLALLVTGCASSSQSSAPLPTVPSDRVFVDGLNRSISLPETPQRVISLAPSNTEILYAIGAGEQVIGRDAFSDYPPEAKDVTDVGGSSADYNTELIVSLKPDLVLASPLNAPEQIQSFQDLGLTVYVLANPLDMQGLFTNLALVGQITGHDEEAKSLVESLQKRVDAVTQELSKAKESPSVFYELDATDPSAPWTTGPGSFVDMLIRMSGGRNIAGELSGAWVQISLEELIRQDPQFILLGDAVLGGITAVDVTARQGWETMTAVKNGQIYPFDGDLATRPGPRLVDALETMARQIHPELFK